MIGAQTREKPEKKKSLGLAAFIILGFATYQFILCFINTNLFSVSNLLVMASEAGLLGLMAVRVLPLCSLPEICLGFFLLFYFLVLTLVRGDIDPSGPRDVAIIFLGYALGRAYPDRDRANRIVWVVSIIALCGAMAEYFMPDTYTRFFDILRYYIGRGVVSDSVRDWAQGNAFISGTRMAGRNILPFLGDRRISSIFLEPVSMGNYAIILCAWSLSFDRKDRRKAFGHLIMSVIFIIASDSRFASLLVFFLAFLRFLPFAAGRLAVGLMPLLTIMGMLIFTWLGLGNSIDDNLTGRIMRSGEATLDLTLPQLAGLDVPQMLGDMGIAYSLETFGVLLCLFLWAVFTIPVIREPRVARFRLMLAIYAMAILVISGTSFYSSKTAVLLWFLYGVLYKSRAAADTRKTMPPLAKTWSFVNLQGTNGTRL